MKRSISEMTLPELKIEHKKMVDAVARLADTKDHVGKVQLNCCQALKFAIECQIETVRPAPITDGSNVISLAEFRAKREFTWV